MENSQPSPGPVMASPSGSPAQKSNNKRIIISVLVSGVFLAFLGGLYFWQNSKNQNLQRQLDAANEEIAKLQQVSEDPETDLDSESGPTAKAYDEAITGQIDGFDTASDSLKDALVNTFYSQAKKDCDDYNSRVSADARLSSVMVVRKVIRDAFASVQFCGSGGSSILVNSNGAWKNVGSLGMAPSCSLVDQYKISKEITSHCFVDSSGDSRQVTYP